MNKKFYDQLSFIFYLIFLILIFLSINKPLLGYFLTAFSLTGYASLFFLDAYYKINKSFYKTEFMRITIMIFGLLGMVIGILMFISVVIF